jgi:hypothetical protein
VGKNGHASFSLFEGGNNARSLLPFSEGGKVMMRLDNYTFGKGKTKGSGVDPW